MVKKIIIIVAMLGWSCDNHNSRTINSALTTTVNDSIQATETQTEQASSTHTIATRIEPPKGYRRSTSDPHSFQSYLRNLKLKPRGSIVNYYNGEKKLNNQIYLDVIDLKIGKKDLHQCADAVMRLRAEYLWYEKKYKDIHFNFTNGHKVEYSEWMKGKRMKIQGNNTWWVDQETPSNTYQDFWNYLELIFMYAGTASLEKELISKDIQEAEIGDVLIQGGHPGHAVIIVDKATDPSTNKHVYLIAQSYMPAQEIQVLVNPKNPALSPWYAFGEYKIVTPEWVFYRDNLKAFE